MKVYSKRKEDSRIKGVNRGGWCGSADLPDEKSKVERERSLSLPNESRLGFRGEQKRVSPGAFKQ